MQLSVHFENTRDSEPKSGPVTAGWFLNQKKGGVIHDAPVYVGFETTPQGRPVTLVDAELTPELDDYLKVISGTVNYVKQTYFLCQTAEEQRPDILIKPVKHR